MSTIGTLTVKSTAGLMTGSLVTLDLNLLLELEPLGLVNPADSNDPSHDVFAVSPRHGKKVHIGSAWTKTLKRGANEGKWFLSITVDDPGLEAPLNVAAFPVKDGEYSLVWNRPRGAAPAKPDQSAA